MDSLVRLGMPDEKFAVVSLLHALFQGNMDLKT